MKNNEHFNSKLSEARERRAKSLLRLFNKGWSVKRLADREGVTTSRIYSLLASVTITNERNDMFSIIEGLTKAVVGVVVETPLSIAADVVTLAAHSPKKMSHTRPPR